MNNAYNFPIIDIITVTANSSSVKAAASKMDCDYRSFYDRLVLSDVPHQKGEKWNDACKDYLNPCNPIQLELPF